MSVNQVYGPDIRNAIAKGDLEKMNVLLIHAKDRMREHAELINATLDLEQAIEKMKKKK